LNNKCESTI